MVIHEGDALMRAQQRAEAKLRFYRHLALALGLSLLLFVVNLFAGRGRWWFLWPAGFVLLSAVIHAAKLYGGRRAMEDLRRRLVDRELKKGQGPGPDQG